MYFSLYKRRTNEGFYEKVENMEFILSNDLSRIGWKLKNKIIAPELQEIKDIYYSSEILRYLGISGPKENTFYYLISPNQDILSNSLKELVEEGSLIFIDYIFPKVLKEINKKGGYYSKINKDLQTILKKIYNNSEEGRSYKLIKSLIGINPFYINALLNPIIIISNSQSENVSLKIFPNFFDDVSLIYKLKSNSLKEKIGEYLRELKASLNYISLILQSLDYKIKKVKRKGFDLNNSLIKKVLTIEEHLKEM